MTDQENMTAQAASQPDPQQDVVLEVQNVTKRFPGVLANDSVNLKLRRGEILALLGENGAGKSTLMNIIYGLYHQDEGDVYLNGKNVRFANPREAIHSGIGMVHQHFQLVDVMTVAENVVLGEENEAPTLRSLFSTFFTLIAGVILAALVVNYNDQSLVYDTFVFGILTLMLPWYLGRYLFRPMGLALLAMLGVVLATEQFDLTYPDQYLFVDGVIIVGILALLFGLIRQLPAQLFSWMQANLRILTLGLQALAILTLLYLGAETNSIGDAINAYTTAIGDAFDGTVTSQFEVLIGLAGMGVLAFIVYSVMGILTGNEATSGRFERFTVPGQSIIDDAAVWTRFVAVVLTGLVALGLVAVLAALSTILLADSSDLIAMREFLALAGGGVLIAAVGSLGLAVAASAVFKHWESVVGGARIIWGVAWRVGLISVALWVGGQVRNISEMAVITSMLQTEVPLEEAELEETDEGATVGAGVETTYMLEPRWSSRIDRLETRDEQIAALLELIDEAFIDEETGEYRGITQTQREAVDDVPPVVRDVTIGLLLILFGMLSIRTWRGPSLLPGALTDGRTLLARLNLPIMLAMGAIFSGAILLSIAELSTLGLAGLVALSIAAFGYTFWRTMQDRQQDPDRIRSITPLDTLVDALADFIYTILSFRQTQEAADRVYELSKRYGLEVDPDAVVEKLPVGLQQRVEIVKALYRKADILILDEPTAVLTPQEGEELFKIMRELASQGVSIIFITHKLKEVFKVATDVVVMRGGKVVGTTTPQEATEASLAAMMVGRDVLLRVEKDAAKPEAPVLRVGNLRAMDDRGALALRGVNFEVKSGEVLGIAGVQGNGQSELVEVLTGLRPMDEGEVELLGEELRPRRYPDATAMQRFMANVTDFLIVGMFSMLFSYFWSYFGEGPETFEALSTQTLIIFLLFDAIYHLGFWIVPVLSRGRRDSSTVQLEGSESVPTANAAGQTPGQIMFNLELTGKQDTTPGSLALVVRHATRSLTRYLFPLYWLLTALLAFSNRDSETEASFTKRWLAVLRNAWYDNLPLTRIRVAHRSLITARRIKDLQTGHVPEDRLRFGMVKPFTVAENLILNDYYESPHAQAPSTVQLPFVSGVYALLFAGIFAVLGYVWLYLWNDSLWNGLLDNFGVPDASGFRTVPSDRAFSSLERIYLNDPLLVSLVALLMMTLLFSVLAYFLTQLIMRYVANPFSFVPPLMIALVGYIAMLLGDSLLMALSLHDTVMLPLIALASDLFSAETNFSDAVNQGILAAASLVFLLVLGLVYDRIGGRVEQTPIYHRLEDSEVGHFVQNQNHYGLGLNIRDALGHSNRLIKEYDIRTPSALTAGGSLSGGNQQKLVVAREFSRRPRLLIASQPTRGIDVGSIEFIHKQIIQQRDRGAAVLLVSAELDEVMSLSDRIAVMYKGEVIKVVEAENATREELGLLMAGIVQ
jgi:ABC-type uncharacterized transport system ATPase subunit